VRATFATLGVGWRRGIIPAVPGLSVPFRSDRLSRWPLLLLLVLAVHLAFGVFDRTLWKPDEPREAAIAGRMARPGADMAVPHLGETAFCEKPPLYYWVATGSIHLFGLGPVPVRLPNLVYALAGALLVGLLANAAAGRVAALAAGLLMGTLYLAYRIEIWIATDALLMASVAGALFACYRGLTARRGWPKVSWYSLMHLFLAVGFLTKNVVAWIVPGLALLAFIAWERRWRELLAWELYAGLALQLAAVLPWVLAVAAEPNGVSYLRGFFVNNLFGRFAPLEGVGYSESHRGWLGKYLVELPIYVLPWTFVMVAALAKAWRMCGETVAVDDGGRIRERAGWRFALAAVIPGLVLLSASTTMRDIYAGVLMPGLALLGGLWAARALASPDRFDQAMVRATVLLLGAVTLLLPVATLITVGRVTAPASPPRLTVLLVMWALALALVARAWRTQRRDRLSAALASAVGVWVVTLLAVAPVLFPVINRSQDLSPVARAAKALEADHPVVLWQPDETTIGVLDFYAGLTPPRITTASELQRRLSATPKLCVLTEVTGGRGKERRVADLGERFGLAVMRRIDLPAPGGRSYAFLALPQR
jgi:4-amino-4-deoxy-L-arabinose transferase-like glycosyltransferase